MLKAIKVRLYPNKDQQFLINKLLGCYRFTFNACLQYKKERYDLDNTPTSLSDF
jgi:putative transposase